MRDLVEYIVKALVDEPSQVDVKQITGEQSLIVEVRVASDDMGKVIGKGGRIVRAIRTVAKAAAAKEGKRVEVEIIQ